MNYVFFFPDEMRAEALHCYGNAEVKTPNYDRLASEGVLFEQCHVQNSVCSPSRCCLVTGQYVHVHGHRTLWNLIKPHEKNLFRYFKEAGYDVRIYGKNDLYAQESIPLCTDEFITFPNTSNTTQATPVTPFGERGYYNFLCHPSSGNYTDHQDYQNVKAGMDFIRSRKPDDKPFVLFLPTKSPHCPYTIQEPYYSMYDENTVNWLREHGTNKPKFHELIRKYRELDEDVCKKNHAIYMGMTSFTDQLLGELMDCMEESGICDDTMLIASSDHGDYAGDYGLVEKWPSACEDVLTRVPLIIKAPHAKAGHRVKELVELFDIMPTMMDSAGLEIKHTHFATSLMPQLQGECGDPQRAVFCEGGYNQNEMHCNEGTHDILNDKVLLYYPKHQQQGNEPESVARATMIRTQTHKLIKRTYGEHELYDLVKDPQELHNYYGVAQYQGVQQALETRLLDWLIATSDVVPFEEDCRELTP